MNGNEGGECREWLGIMGAKGVMRAVQGRGVQRKPRIPPITPFTPPFSIRVYLRLFAAVVLGMALAGCGRHSTSGNGAAVLRYPISLEPLSLDPAVLNE